MEVKESGGCACITYECGDCGEFQVIHSYTKIKTECYSCGKSVRPVRISWIAVGENRNWKTYIMPDVPIQNK